MNDAKEPTPLERAEAFMEQHRRLLDALDHSQSLAEKARDHWMKARKKLAQANADSLADPAERQAKITSTTDEIEVALKEHRAARDTVAEVQDRIDAETSAVIAAHDKFAAAMEKAKADAIGAWKKRHEGMLREAVRSAAALEQEFGCRLPELLALPSASPVEAEASRPSPWVETLKALAAARSEATLRAEIQGEWEVVKGFTLDEREYLAGDRFTAWAFDQPRVLRRMAAKGSVKRIGTPDPVEPPAGVMIPHNADWLKGQQQQQQKPGEDLLSGLARPGVEGGSMRPGDVRENAEQVDRQAVEPWESWR
jgi:hypothetical protein